jgi:hypothetical protein
MRARIWLVILSVALAAALLAGCGGTQQNASGQVRLMLTDQAGPLEHVLVTIEEVAAHSPGAGWQTIAAKDVIDSYISQPIDLITLHNIEKLIAAQTLPTGMYTQMRLILDDSASVVVGGQTYPLTVPSGVQTGFKTNPFTVAAGQTTYVLVDIESAKIVAPGQPGQPYILPPTAITATVYTGPFGSLAGTVSPPSSKAVVTAYYAGTEKPAASTSIDPVTGAFALAQLLPGQYWVGAAAAGFQPFDSRPTLYTVTGGATTDVPAITLVAAP